MDGPFQAGGGDFMQHSGREDRFPLQTPMTQPQIFPITGMTCGSCAAKVSARLLEHPDIASAAVTVNPSQAKLETTSPLSDEAVNEWLRPLGRYRVAVSEAPAPSAALPAKSAQTYRPLLILLAYLLAVTAIGAVDFIHLEYGVCREENPFLLILYTTDVFDIDNRSR